MLRAIPPFVLALALSACIEAPQEVKDLKAAAVGVAAEATKVAAGVVDTQTACQLAGQSEAFCGCLQTELGPQIKPEQIDALAAGVNRMLAGAPAAQSAAEIADPATQKAMLTCAAKAAVAGAAQ